MVRFYSAGHAKLELVLICAELDRIDLGSGASFIVQALREQQRKVVENIGYSRPSRKGDHLGLLIKTESTQEEWCNKLSFVLFKALRGVKHSRN